MLGLILSMAAQQAAEITPSMDTMSIVTAIQGTCLTTPLQPAAIRVQWTATNFNSVTQIFKVYRDGVYVTQTTSLQYVLSLAGLVENNQQHPQDITFNYRVDIVRTSDLAVLATKSASVTKSYGNCTGGL